MKLESRSVEQTHQIGQALSRQLQPNDVLLLLGDMGAGKSELTRGIARGLGVTCPVASPSFTILNVYDEGKIPLYHFDWYRLNSAEELYEMGMDEYLGGDGVAVVEWPSRCPEAVPEKYLEVRIDPVDDCAREIVLTPRGGFRELSLEAMENEAAGG